jgi:RNA ligase
MNYKFPEIRTIDDVLPHIQGRDEFIVAGRDYGTIINYAVAFEDTFPPVNVAGGSAKMRAERALTNAMRRECRGLIFYPDGRIMSRPLHKWFNIGERAETLPRNINWDQTHTIFEKLDGSMVRPVVVDGYIRWGTKMGITEVSMNAEQYVAEHPRYTEFASWAVDNNLTPIFEWCSRKNRIVLDYPEDQLILLAVRHNITGEYLDVREQKMLVDQIQRYRIPVANTISSFGTVEELIAHTRGLKDAEGFVVAFVDGHRIKIKADEYVRIHRCLDRIRFDRNIVDLILNQQIDDVAPLLPEHEADRVRQFAARFGDRLHCLVQNYDRYWNTVVAAGLDRKSYAQQWMPTIKTNDPFASQYVFGRFGNRNGRTMILDHIAKHVTSNVKWDECAAWMGL